MVQNQKSLFLIISFVLFGCATTNTFQQPIEDLQPASPPVSMDTKSESSSQNEMEAFKNETLVPAPNGITLSKEFFYINYNSKQNVANYVRYDLTKEQVENSRFKREDNFHGDPELKKLKLPMPVKNTYLNQKYDRGHLAPAEDFAWSRESIDSTFVMSNMTPQKTTLNTKAWKFLEERVRNWACQEDSLQIVVGTIISPSPERIKLGVAVPEKFFKAVFDKTPPEKAICFIYSQTDEKDVYRDRYMSVEKCEQQIGYSIEFALDPKKIMAVKFTSNIDDWKEGKCTKQKKIESQKTTKNKVKKAA